MSIGAALKQWHFNFGVRRYALRAVSRTRPFFAIGYNILTRFDPA